MPWLSNLRPALCTAHSLPGCLRWIVMPLSFELNRAPSPQHGAAGSHVIMTGIICLVIIFLTLSTKLIIAGS